MISCKRITIKDVAREVGVTHTTVSRVIHDDRRISEGTKQRVRQAMALMRYEPNLVARGLVSRKMQAIALITPDLAPFTFPILQSVSESCIQAKYTAMMFPTNTWVQEKLSFEWVASNWLVDGILVYNLIHHPQLSDEIIRLRDRQVPFVFINKFLNERSIHAVGVDNEDAVDQAVAHMVDRGHCRLGMIHGNLASEDGKARVDAFHLALERRGLSFNEHWSGCGLWHDTEAYHVMRKILQREERPTAMFCANDLMAIGAMQAIHDHGLRVPEDVAVVGFDDLETGRYVKPSLTTIRPPLQEVGRQAFDLLKQVIQHPGLHPQQIKFKAELIVRDSTRGTPALSISTPATIESK